MTSLPALHSTADVRSITERVNVLIRDLNSGRVADLAQALTDIATLQTDVTTLQTDVTTLQGDLSALDDRVTDLEGLAAADATTFLGADVALNNTSNYFNGPSTGNIGASGQKWLIAGIAAVRDTTTGFAGSVRLWNGSAAIDGRSISAGAANQAAAVPLMAIVTLTGATTFTLQARCITSTSGVLLTTGHLAGSPSNLATQISAVRLS